eukprot:EG_transcript_32533
MHGPANAVLCVEITDAQPRPSGLFWCGEHRTVHSAEAHRKKTSTEVVEFQEPETPTSANPSDMTVNDLLEMEMAHKYVAANYAVVVVGHDIKLPSESTLQTVMTVDARPLKGPICTMQTVSMKRIGQVGVKEVCTVVLQAVRHGFEAKALIPVLTIDMPTPKGPKYDPIEINFTGDMKAFYVDGGNAEELL